MNSLSIKLAIGFALCSCAAAALPADMHADAMRRAEARQMQEQFTPQAQAQLSRREAYAAYQDALKDCRAAGKNARTSCMKDAKSRLQQDLAYAKRQGRGEDYGNVGSSGAGNTGRGSDAGSGMR